MKFVPEVKKIFSDIARVRIQGADNIASAAVEALAIQLNASKAFSKEEFVSEALSTIKFLKESRPTEPALRNALRFVFAEIRKSREQDVERLKALVSREARNYHRNSLFVKQRIAEYGARLVPQDAVVLNHCHSSTVMRVIKRAHDLGKKPVVYCTESRPLFQGRLSARELSDYGVETRLIVDSAVASFFKEFDLVLVGSDAITSEGDLVNKVGTAGISLIANDFKTRFYSCTGIHKFDPLTLWGFSEPIEQRSGEEVWCLRDRRKARAVSRRLSILNPAFDLTRAEDISAYVTDLGIVPPQGITELVWKEFGLDKRELYDFYLTEFSKSRERI